MVTLQDVPVIVSSFDGYAACWPAWCHGFQKYWADYPGPVYFISNHLEAPCFNTFKTGDDRGWSGRLKMMLEHLDSEIVLYTQEEFWIRDTVDSSNIQYYVQLIADDVADHVRLAPDPSPDAPYGNDERLGILTERSEYRTSTQMGLWRRSVLLDLLDVTENVWKFEKFGTQRSRKYGTRFLSVTKRRFGVHYDSVVDGGIFKEKAFEFARREGLTLHPEQMPTRPRKKRPGLVIRMKIYGKTRRIRQRLKNLINS